MKMQMTLVAAAVSLALSGAALSQETVTSKSQLDDGVDWGVDSSQTGVDNNQWGRTAGTPIPTFDNAQGEVIDLQTDASAAVSGENLSNINQDGEDNQASVNQHTQAGNESRIRQTGTQFDAYVEQSGSVNLSDIDQGGLAGGSTGIANVLQTGTEDRSRISQYGTGNFAEVQQLAGSDNSSVIHQGNEGGSASGHTAWVVQTGTNNVSYIGQAYGHNSYADARQAGDEGTSYILQYGSDNEAYLVQEMDSYNDESFILQDSTAGGSHYAHVTQGGGSIGAGANISTVTQVGATIGTATVVQSGSGNWASTTQY